MFTDSPVLPEICEVLDFRTDEQLPKLARVGPVFFNRKLKEPDAMTELSVPNNNVHRKLQFEGARCTPSVSDEVAENPLLTTFNELLELAGLEDIFLCAGA